jgi:hypothetical protein
LRRLTERSGRGDGVFAGQWHMSVATLHRYGNGDAVPGDCAPATVEPGRELPLEQARQLP